MDVGGFVSIPLVLVLLCRKGAINCVFPVVANGMDFGMVGRIFLADFLGTLVDGVLHGLPLVVGDFEFFDSPRIELVAIDDDVLHSALAVRFKRYIIDTAHPSIFGVEGAVL